MPDINEAQNSSGNSPQPDADLQTGSDIAGDASADSSTAADATQESESSTDQGAKEPRSLSDVLDIEGDKLLAEEPPAEEEAESGAETKPESEAGPDKGKEEASDKDVPFHKHPRWQEKQKQVADLTAKVKEFEPRIQVLDEIEQHTGGKEGFENMRALVRNFNENPADAVPMLEQLLADAKARGGLTVTDDAIREKLEAGSIDEDTARELQQARLERERSQKAAQTQTEQAQKAARKEMATALDGWEKNIRERNPDYEKLKPQVEKAFKVACYENPPANTQEAIQLAQQAYDEVLTTVRQLVPARRASSPMRSTSGIGKPAHKPKSVDEAMDHALRSEGLI